jgi:antirestriction protein
MKHTNEETAPRLYVGTYAKYNSGSIKGAWLALTDFDDREAFLAACRELHKDETDPELMFQDSENIPAGLYSESTCPDLWEILNECERHGVELETLSAFVAGGLGDWDEVQACAERFCGSFRSIEDFAEHLCEDCGTLNEMPEHLRCYFDVKSYARDLFIGGDYSELDDPAGGVLIFANYR